MNRVIVKNRRAIKGFICVKKWCIINYVQGTSDGDLHDMYMYATVVSNLSSWWIVWGHDNYD